MVVDSSVLLAVAFDEPHARWAAEQLEKHEGELLMSTVNLTETLIRLKDRHPSRYPGLEASILGSAIRFVGPDVEQARTAAAARLAYPLNLGDCFAYALAVANKCAILTLDEGFRRADRPVLMPG